MEFALLPGLLDRLFQLPRMESRPERGSNGLVFLGAVVMANELRAHAIMTLIRKGSMTRCISWLRPRYSAIYAVGQDQDVAHELALNWGVVPLLMPFDPHDLEKNIGQALHKLLQRRLVRAGSHVVVVSSIAAGDGPVDAVQLREVR